MTPPPLLLVSVRSAEEAQLALEGGADIIDVKEPLRGPLGAADPHALREIMSVVAGRRPLSAALGELAEENSPPPRELPGLDWIKFGLSGLNTAADLRGRWNDVRSGFAGVCDVVPAAYADHDAARSLAPRKIALALARRYQVFLLDTFVKEGASVFDLIAEDQLHMLRCDVRSLGAQFALAGSLQIEHLDRVMQLAPEIVGVRGAVCEGGRKGRVSAKRVSEFRRRLQDAASAK